MPDELTRSEKFNKAVQLLKQLSEAGELYISLIPPFDVSLEIDRRAVARCREAGLSAETFKKESNRVGELLMAILEEKEDVFIDSQIERSELSGEEAQRERKMLQDELATVRENLFDTHLKGRYDLKVSSKAPSFTGIDWDIKLKTVDAKLEKIKFPYATCRIRFQREFEISPVAVLGRNFFDAVQLNFSRDDIDYLIRVFRTIRQHLAEMEEE